MKEKKSLIRKISENKIFFGGTLVTGLVFGTLYANFREYSSYAIFDCPPSVQHITPELKDFFFNSPLLEGQRSRVPVYSYGRMNESNTQLYIDIQCKDNHIYIIDQSFLNNRLKDSN